MALTSGQGGALVLCVFAVIFSRDLYGLMQGPADNVRSALEHGHPPRPLHTRLIRLARVTFARELM